MAEAGRLAGLLANGNEKQVICYRTATIFEKSDLGLCGMFCDTILSIMPRDGAIIIGDLVGKLGASRVACDKCNRAGSYG
jgi:hypothetical protein